jgi:hypothetical protein
MSQSFYPMKIQYDKKLDAWTYRWTDEEGRVKWDVYPISIWGKKYAKKYALQQMRAKTVLQETMEEEEEEEEEEEMEEEEEVKEEENKG